MVQRREKCGQVELLCFSTNKFAIYCTAVVFYVKFAQNKRSLLQITLLRKTQFLFFLFLLMKQTWAIPNGDVIYTYLDLERKLEFNEHQKMFRKGLQGYLLRKGKIGMYVNIF